MYSSLLTGNSQEIVWKTVKFGRIVVERIPSKNYGGKFYERTKFQLKKDTWKNKIWSGFDW